MRTTVNIHDGLLETAKRRAQQEGKTLGDVVESALHRYLLEIETAQERVGPPLPVFGGGTGMVPGIDPTSNDSLYDAMYEEEDAELRAQVRR
ncbi:antitoxin [Nocardioides stalactiti]|uniref:antitoxin n=1 Tax=Nocardioides stalactiti TaxID=2755356 RepID=UPI001602AAF6|nr:antitoxin [Nocardioides stalactiti]